MGALIRVMLVDDDSFVRTTLSKMLDAAEGLSVVMSCADAEQAIRESRVCRPDVILMDIHLPGIDGASATRLIIAQDPEVVILAITSLADDESVGMMLAAGATGYIVKSAPVATMVLAIRSAVAGLSVVPAGVAARLGAGFVRAAERPHLTDTEGRVLELLGQGHTNAQIGALIYRSASFVKRTVSQLMARFGVSTRVELAASAERWKGRPGSDY